MRRVVVVDPLDRGGSKIQQILEHAGFRVILLRNAETTLRTLYQVHPDLVVVMNDSLTGQEVCSRVNSSMHVPIIVVGAEDELSTATMIEMGADMYVVEPVSRDELVARVHALLRRHRSTGPTAVRLNPESSTADMGDDVIELTPTEFRLFSYFAVNAGKVIPYGRLIDVVWGGKVTMDTLHTYVRRLKQKLHLGESGYPRLVSHRGEGYLFAYGEFGEHLSPGS